MVDAFPHQKRGLAEIVLLSNGLHGAVGERCISLHNRRRVAAKSVSVKALTTKTGNMVLSVISKSRIPILLNKTPHDQLAVARLVNTRYLIQTRIRISKALDQIPR